ncbi:glycerol-3-phosphate 2-O-acyltransferase 6 [Brachypodium distachyon]|uniref:Phospholipid/glycerol acyltransferase domain-containing protein n=1 Tax=Brachypodium distachyon TaxID=15368 RepID=I1H9B8_BRADI|nr:glycerol-3-phosphate 2-O-acyltransferase 6 [Brachypodium distachyon]KQK23463.1 hypothetical protein BRADI_1g73935v3 [Brachypodium distachyon]|eukprot:XP_003562033.1 glycerol-3-phosphate 2-O-acyltransferase 6 [Brachypodium distachyon]
MVFSSDEATTKPTPFPDVHRCDASASRRGSHTVVSSLGGTLLRSRSAFPYYALVAFETGGVPRLALLLLLAPLAAALSRAVSESAGLRVLVFAATAGARVSDIESAARAALPRFYAADVHPAAWRVFSACGGGRRLVVTATPRVMAEPFLRDHLGVDAVAGTELATWRGRATGLVDARWGGVLVGERKAEALRELVGDGNLPDVALGGRPSDYEFMRICKEAYLVPDTPVEAVRADKLPKPVLFHDGRLVQRPTPLAALLAVAWFPFAFLLACARVATASLVPMPFLYHAICSLGVRIVVRGAPPPRAERAKGRTGSLFVCSHRTLLDAVFLSVALGRPVPVVTYSLSRLSELLSPIPTVRLTRDRATDAAAIRELLAEGDLAICPEGTTSREPFLLRFSSLFAELTDHIVPVATDCEMSMYHGTTARGWKGMDPFYFFMNPRPRYTVTFLDKLPAELTCGGGGRSCHEVANHVQKLLASSLSYECTGFTRKDKYRALAGNDGIVTVNTAKN